MKTKITKYDIPDMLKLKNKGWTFQRIADKYKIHTATIIYHFKRSGKNYLRNKSGAKPVFRKKAPYKKLVAEPVKMYSDYLVELENKKPDPLKKLSTN